MKKTLLALLLAVLAIGFSACNSSEPDEPERTDIGTFKIIPEFPEGVEVTTAQLDEYAVRIYPKTNITWVVTGYFRDYRGEIKGVQDTYIVELASPIFEDPEEEDSSKKRKYYYGKAEVKVLQDVHTDVTLKMALTTAE